MVPHSLPSYFTLRSLEICPRQGERPDVLRASDVEDLAIEPHTHARHQHYMKRLVQQPQIQEECQ